MRNLGISSFLAFSWNKLTSVEYFQRMSRNQGRGKREVNERIDDEDKEQD